MRRGRFGKPVPPGRIYAQRGITHQNTESEPVLSGTPGTKKAGRPKKNAVSHGMRHAGQTSAFNRTSSGPLGGSTSSNISEPASASDIRKNRGRPPKVSPDSATARVTPTVTSRHVPAPRGNIGDSDTEKDNSSDEEVPLQQARRRFQQAHEFTMELDDKGEVIVQLENADAELTPGTKERVRRDNIKESSINEDLFSNVTLGKILGSECLCGDDCLQHVTRADIKPLRCATVDQYRMKKLRGHMLETMSGYKERNLATKAEGFNFRVGGRTMCRDAFRLCHGWSADTTSRTASAVLKGVTEQHDLPKRKRSWEISCDASPTKTTFVSDAGGNIIAWLEGYVELFGEGQPDTPLIYMDQVSIKAMHDDYMLENRGFCKTLKIGRFTELWNENFSKKVRFRARKPFGTCTECKRLKTALNETRRMKDQFAMWKKEFRKHLEGQKSERQSYYRHRQKGRALVALSIIMDGMDQSKLNLPHTKVPWKDQSDFCETKITGVLVHGKTFRVYVSEPQVKSDSNLSLHCLHDTIMSQLDEGELPEVLYLQVDGGSENKNQWVLMYLAMLLKLRIFKKIKMQFLPVGHTHEDIDQCFSRIAVALNQQDAYTFESFVTLVRNSILKEGDFPEVIQLGHVYDFKKWLGSGTLDVKAWTDNHIYRFSLNPETNEPQMHYKMFSTTQGYFGKHGATTTRSFKELERKAQSDPTLWETHAGIPLAVPIPIGEPEVAENHNYAAPKLEKIMHDPRQLKQKHHDHNRYIAF